MAATRPRQLWTAFRLVVVPLLLVVSVFAAAMSILPWWLGARDQYDKDAIKEWIKEARVSNETVRARVSDYLASARRQAELAVRAGPEPAGGFQSGEFFLAKAQCSVRKQEIEEMLETLGVPPTKMYTGQLPLFPVIYRLEVKFQAPDLPEELRPTIAWDSGLQRRRGQYREMKDEPIHENATITIHYSLHTYNKLQQDDQAAAEQQQWATALALIGSAPVLVWVWVARRRERERERQQSLAQHQIDQAERLLLEEELRRREAERRRDEAERELLRQQLATQDAERKALELRSEIFASIGIMAGSYAHNIKNLLVRPNDLLSRCLEVDGLPHQQRQMIHEVHETLGTVTERLQQILHTVRRDPTRAELSQLDLHAELSVLVQTWQALAIDKWKMNLTLEPCPEPLLVEGDLSHLQQAVENLLFNARDATFEMRNHLRNLARGGSAADRKQALIAAAAWKGQVTLRCHREDNVAVVEVRDNGIGMTDEVRQRCLEPHFTTKRDNALYEGHSTGMGLGLSFVAAILERHHAKLEIDSEPLRGTTFRIRFPLTGTPAST